MYFNQLRLSALLLFLPAVQETQRIGEAFSNTAEEKTAKRGMKFIIKPFLCTKEQHFRICQVVRSSRKINHTGPGGKTIAIMKRKDISRLRRTRSANLQLGLIVSLGLVITAFNWTVEENVLEQYENRIVSDELEIEVVRTQTAKPRPKPPQVITPEIEPVSEPVEPFNPEPLPIDIPVVADPVPIQIVEPPVVYEPVPVPAKPEPAAPPIFKVVEEMPLFGDCTDEGLKAIDRKKCSDKALLSYIYDHIRYPEPARDNGIEGTVFVQFVVEKDGSLSQIKVLRDIGGGCGKEVERIVGGMPKWSAPGKQRGRPVRVQFNLPVKFKLH